MRLMALLIVMIAANTVFAADVFPLREGDRVAIVGNTFIERAQDSGWLELALTRLAPESDVVFRNLGWSGDVVTARARRYFGKTEDGFARLMKHLDLVKPTVILVSYGTSKAFAGQAEREDFLAGYRQLLDAMGKRADRIVIITSPPIDRGASPAPRVADRVNEELAWQVGALRKLAQERGLGFIDIFTPLRQVFSQDGKTSPHWTTNGMHLTPRGYLLVAAVLRNELQGGRQNVNDLLEAVASAEESPAEKKLREAIIKKNRTFFHRLRPENETYLRGFRKHEQGQNAEEIYEFADLARAMDQKIFELRRALPPR